MERATPPTVDQRAGERLRWAWLALTLVLLATIAIRVRLAPMPLDRDEGGYAYSGQQLLSHGTPPYRSGYNLRFPGSVLAYAAFEAVGGPSATAIHCGFALVVASATVAVFAIGRRAWGTDAAGLAAAAAFAALSLDQHALALAGQAELLALPPALLGLWLLLAIPPGGPSAGRCLVSGTLLGLALLMKQPAAVAVALGLGTVAVRSARGQRLRRCVLVSAGVALPLLAVGAWLWWAGVFPKFWFWTVTYARSYGSQVPLDAAIHVLGFAVGRLAQDSWPVWSLAGVGLIVTVWARTTRRAAGAVAVCAAVSFAAVSVGLLFRNHYFIFLMPAAAVAVGGLFAGKRRWVAASVLAVAIGGQLIAQRAFLFQLSPEAACRATYTEEAFVEAAAVGRYLRAHAPPDSVVAVLGSEPEICFEARMRSATAHLYAYPLLEPQPHAAEMQHEMADDITRARPAYVVWVHLGNSWFQPQDRSPSTWIFDWWSAYAKGYDLVGAVEGPGAATVDEDPAAGAAQRAWTSPGLFVFRRRPGV